MPLEVGSVISEGRSKNAKRPVSNDALIIPGLFGIIKSMLLNNPNVSLLSWDIAPCMAPPSVPRRVQAPRPPDHSIFRLFLNEGGKQVICRLNEDGSPGEAVELIPGRPPWRPAATVAGHWPDSLPWWHHAFCDPYERINVISHGLAGLAMLFNAPSFLLLHGTLPLGVFFLLGSLTFLASAVSHSLPDSRLLEKVDHYAIVCGLIFGSSLSLALASGCSIWAALVSQGFFLVAAAIDHPRQ